MAFTSFDYRSQIRDNCEFFVGREDFVSVIITKDPTGDFRAYAIRSSEESRDALLSSDLCVTAQKAIESLHTKSCEAAQQYITTNGFSHPPDLKKAKLDDDEDDGEDDEDAASVVSSRSTSSTVALSDKWASSDEEALTPASSADNRARRDRSMAKKVKIFSESANQAVPRGKEPRGPRARFSRLPYDLDYSNDDDRQHQQGRTTSYHDSAPPTRSSYRAPPPPPPGGGPPLGPHWNGPPGPPPPMRCLPILPAGSQPMPHHCQQSSGHSVQPPFPPTLTFQQPHAPTAGPVPSIAQTSSPTRTTTTSTQFNNHPNTANSNSNNNNNHASSSAANAAANPNLVTQAQPNTSTQPQGRLYDVRLTIRWPHHGEQRILESSRASIRALQETAVAYVRAHLDAFDGVTPADRDRAWGLRACVRTAFFGHDAYDMRTYRGDDLTKLFAVLSAGGIPRFEVEVNITRGVWPESGRQGIS